MSLPLLSNVKNNYLPFYLCKYFSSFNINMRFLYLKSVINSKNEILWHLFTPSHKPNIPKHLSFCLRHSAYVNFIISILTTYFFAKSETRIYLILVILKYNMIFTVLKGGYQKLSRETNTVSYFLKYIRFYCVNLSYIGKIKPHPIMPEPL